MRILKAALAAAVFVVASVSASSAATVSYQTVTDWGLYDLTDTDNLGGGYWDPANPAQHVVPGGSVSGLYRSPFDGSGVEDPAPNVANLPYWAIGPNNPVGNTDNSATLKFDSSMHMFSFIWGSVDSYNSITFFDGLSMEFELTVADLAPGFPMGIGAIFATVVGLTFDSVVFKSTDQEALEVAMFTAAVPVPPAIALLASGLAGLGFIGWRRKRAAAATSAA